MREADLAWAAGIVDGEGCIALHTVKSQATGSLCYVLRLSVANTSLVMLHRLVEIFGVGNIIPQKRYQDHHKNRWSWQVCSKQAELVLTQIVPYLVNKREEARMGLLSRKLMGQHGVNRENSNVVELAAIKEQLSTLKKATNG